MTGAREFITERVRLGSVQNLRSNLSVFKGVCRKDGDLLLVGPVVIRQ